MAKVNKIDYSKAKIYKIEPLNGEEGDIYIGSTSKEYLSQRMTAHRSAYKRWLNNKAGYTSSFGLFKKYGIENCSIVLLEMVDATNNDALKAREQYYIKTNKCVNKVIPLQTTKEYNKIYKANHKEEIKLYEQMHRERRNDITKRYHDNNQDKIKLRINAPYQCACGSNIRKGEIARHNKTKKHTEYIKIV